MSRSKKHNRRINNKVQDAKMGSFLIFPMLTKSKNSFEKAVKKQKTEKNGKESIIKEYRDPTYDIAPNVQEMFDEDKYYIAKRWRIEEAAVNRELFGDVKDYTLEIDGGYEIKIGDMVIYQCRNDLVFIALLIVYSDIKALEKVYNLGYPENNCSYRIVGQNENFKFGQKLQAWLNDTFGLISFYTPETFMLEPFLHNFAVVGKRFDTIEQMKQLTFKMHLMVPFDWKAKDNSEEDIYFAYAAKDQNQGKKGSYRWGCCVTSQTISYVVAVQDFNFDTEKENQIRDVLPVIMLALYEKYVCLYFEKVLLRDKKIFPCEIKKLKKKMIQFSAYGIVPAVTVSRWYNIRMIYSHLLIYFGVPEAIQDISNKIEMLNNDQKEKRDRKMNYIIFVITVLSFFSIIDSIISILDAFDLITYTITSGLEKVHRVLPLK